MMRYANIYERSGRVFVRSEDKTVAGYHFAQDNVMALNATDHTGIGAALKAALEASRESVPIPPRHAMAADAPSALYLAAGVRTWREFAKGAKSISVHQGDGQIKLVPWKNEGVLANFVPIKDRARTLPDTSPDADLGAAVVAALADID